MKSRTLPIILVVLSLSFSTLACGLFSNSASSDSDTSFATIEAPAQKAQPTAEETPNETVPTEQSSGQVPDLTSLIPAVDVNGDGTIDICEAVPAVAWEQVMGRPQAGDPMPFEDPSLGTGCAFDFGQDSSEAYFAYVTIGTEQQFNDALANTVQAEPVTTIGDSAFLNYGPDARQLWVRVGEKAMLVAIGDRENVAGALIVAQYLVENVAVPSDVTAAAFAGAWMSADPKPADINKTPQYCQVDISAQGNQLTIKFASVCNPLTYIDYMTSTVTFDGSPIVLTIKDFVGGETTVTLTLNGDILNVKTVYVDKDGNPGVNKSDDFKK